MNWRNLTLVFLLFASALSSHAQADFTLQALDGFGGSDGWLAPAETSGHLSTTGVQRGLTYNAQSNQLYLVDRNGGTNVRVLDGNTGALVRSLDMTGVTGGTFAANMVGVGSDGAIYMGNLSTAAADPFRIYRWADSNAAPTVAFSAVSGLVRTGDSFAVFGSGINTRIVASGSGHNQIAVFNTANGTTFNSVSSSAIAGTPTGAFRLGIDFVDANTVIGKQTGTALYTADLTTSIGQTTTLTSAGEAPLAYHAADKQLATVDINSNLVRLYDATNLSGLTLASSLNNTSSFTANANGTGDLAFGVAVDGLRLYAMNSNNGIQAFRVVSVPEPSSLLLVGLIGMGFVAYRSRRSNIS